MAKEDLILEEIQEREVRNKARRSQLRSYFLRSIILLTILSLNLFHSCDVIIYSVGVIESKPPRADNFIEPEK